MRPLTKAIFEREGKTIVGSRWTLEQVQQAYEKADRLLDYISEYKTGKYGEPGTLEQNHDGFEAGLEACVTKDLSDKTVQALSLGVLKNILERGLDTLAEVAKIYQSSPETFKTAFASSKQAFLKDQFLMKDVPVNSFSSFRTGDNPAMTHDERVSQLCADLYQNSDLRFGSGASLLFTRAGNQIFNETRWVQGATEDLFQKRLGTHIESFSPAMILSRQAAQNG